VTSDVSEPPIKKTRSRKALNAANLEALGPERLAAILLAVADDLPATKRRLRLELAAKAGAGDLAAEIEKHLDAVAAARGKINWRKLKPLRQELDLTRSMIAVRLAETSPGPAVRLLLRFVGLERGVLARTKDARGEIAQAFAAAIEDLARVAATAKAVILAADVDLADAVFDALAQASVDAMGPIARAVVPALDAAAIAALRGRIETEMAPRRRISAGWRDALHAVLDAQDDADAYAATFSPSEAVLPPVGARIAQRFLRNGQVEAAERALEASNPHAGGGKSGAATTGRADAGLLAWESARIDVLEAQGHGAEAQAARWAAFERDLSREHLAAYLRRLEGFDDVVAADRAIDYAAGFRPFSRALDFLIAWPGALPQAATLVLERASEIDGLAIETNEAAVRALEGRSPLAATLLLRAMLAAVFRFSQVDLYPRLLDWMAQAASLAVQIDDFQGRPTHAAFEAEVKGWRQGRY
jgi:hypothetical protein